MEANKSSQTSGKPLHEIRVRNPKKSVYEHLQRIAEDQETSVSKLIKMHLPDIIRQYPSVK